MICKISPKLYSSISGIDLNTVISMILNDKLKTDSEGYIEVEEIAEIQEIPTSIKKEKSFGFGATKRNYYFDKYDSLPDTIIDSFENSEKRSGYGKSIGRIKA